MKSSKHIILSFLAAASIGFNSGCAPSTSSTASSSFTNSDAAHSANVSGIYALSSYGTIGSWTGIDIKWKDSVGIVRAMSAYAGKPILLSFWETTPAAAAMDEASLDSAQSDLGDSVRIVTVAEDITSNPFQTVYNYVSASKVSVQVVVDSVGLAQIQYSELEDGRIGRPETFVLKPNGSIMADEEGFVTSHSLDSLVRSAYH